MPDIPTNFLLWQKLLGRSNGGNGLIHLQMAKNRPKMVPCINDKRPRTIRKYFSTVQHEGVCRLCREPLVRHGYCDL